MALLSSVVDGFSLDRSNHACVSLRRPWSLLSLLLLLLSPSEDSCCVDVLGELLEELGRHWMAEEGVAPVLEVAPPVGLDAAASTAAAADTWCTWCWAARRRRAAAAPGRECCGPLLGARETVFLWLESVISSVDLPVFSTPAAYTSVTCSVHTLPVRRPL